MMTKKALDGASKLERKTIEKNRRLHMKSLCFKLSSLLPKDNTNNNLKDTQPQHDHLEQATNYIKDLQKRVEQLKQKKLNVGVATDHVSKTTCSSSSSSEIKSFQLPIIETRELEDYSLEILLICGIDKRCVLYEAIQVVEEEGAKVVNASSYTVSGKIFYTIHSHVPLPRIGLEASRVTERLKKLVQC